MRKNVALIFSFFIITINAFSQHMSISGNVQDTVAKAPLQYSVAMAIRIRDSIMVAHTRTDVTGHFELKNLPIDTLQVIISNPRFGDKSFYVFGSPTNNIFDFGKIILPSKSQQLKEVVIYAFKDPVYYKGDTLVYTVDSFKVKQNATVEDLLKRLPGIKVDSKGKITSQGKEISQVLVDGDEFFGSDPTIATKNLAAKSVESVQVYEKKNDKATEGGDETVQVMNLKLKDDAKKGYFGKVSSASDGKKFYEGDLLANKFSNTRKVSVFLLASNTPHSSFEGGDVYKYGLDNESNYQMDENGNYTMTNQNNNEGIPRTLKSGFYYNDKISKKIKLGFNYIYNNNQLTTSSITRSQYFLTDSSYVTDNASNNLQKSEAHSVNFKLTQTLDSLTELIIEPKLNLNSTDQNNYELTKFLTSTDTLIHQTDITNTNKASGYDLNTNVKLNRKFKKKDRTLYVTYNLEMNDNRSTGVLKSFNTFYNSTIPNDSINQQKINTSNTQAHNALAVYTEPLTKKIKLEFEYSYNNSIGKQNKIAQNYFNGEYAVYDSLHTNNFENTRMANRLGLKFIYDIKKYSFNIGSRIRNVDIVNSNLITQQQIKQSINNILPYLGYIYKFSQNSRLNFRYYTSSNQPSINQLQPIPDNSNPNRVVVGNPDLLPTFSHNFNASYNTYKPVSGKYTWCGANYVITNNAFANSIVYDNLGRAIIKTVNVNGNTSAYAYAGTNFPFFQKKLEIGPNLNFNYSNSSGYINNQKNSTTNTGITGQLNISVHLDTLDFGLSYSYNYNSPSSTLSTSIDKPYSKQHYNAYLQLKLPFKFLVETEVEYNINSQRAAGYNINYVLWNGSISKRFFKNENFILAVTCNDILNQNISTSRIVQDNVITDNKTNIISRYFLLKLTYKFNSTKTKENDDMF